MNNTDYKEVWQKAYNEAIEKGKSDLEACIVGDKAVEEYYSQDISEFENESLR